MAIWSWRSKKTGRKDGRIARHDIEERRGRGGRRGREVEDAFLRF